MQPVLRDATLRDIPYVRKLAVDAATWSIPHTRQVSPDQVRQLVASRLQKLELTLHRDNFKTLVVEDADRKETVAYIMLHMAHEEESTGESQCFIVDMAVRQDCWDHGVGWILIQGAVDAAAAHGLKYLVGRVSKANERTMAAAIEKAGFEVERYQIVKRIQDSTPH